MIEVLVGNCLEKLKLIPSSCIESVITDPPYEIAFLGNQWDKAGVAFSPEVWTEVLRVLRPGGHLLSFGGTRTAHRVACAIEDAGFEIRDSIAWIHSQGFPKSSDLGKAVSKTSPERSERWEGWGTALKPAFEPIIVARKPFIGTVAKNLLTNGVGGINIDGTRIETNGEKVWAHFAGNGSVVGLGTEGAMDAYQSGDAIKKDRGGRWPANVVIDDNVAIDLEDKARFFYCAKANKHERPSHGEVIHPTVKPLDLMRWLVTLTTPPGGVVLDPFAGSGTTLEAAFLEGMDAVGMELTEQYVPLIAQRIARHDSNLVVDPGWSQNTTTL